MPTRPARVVVVTGTGTEVGKTWVSCALIRSARSRGVRTAARKPVQSYSEGDTITDADLLAEASGEEAALVCPPHRRYPLAMAPPMAAAALGFPVPDLGALLHELDSSWPGRPSGGGPVDVGLVEGAGGVASPLAADGDSADLARELPADIAVVVADPLLGVINSVRLSSRALHPIPVVVHLNRFDPVDDLHRRNLAWLREVDGLRVTTEVGELLEAVLGP